MTKKHVYVLVLLVVLGSVIWLTGCTTSPGEAAQRDADAAGAVVKGFYNWYLAYPGNRMVDEIYQQSKLLAPACIEAAEEEIEAMRAAGPGGGDIFLCAQDVPAEMRYQPAKVNGGEATVTVQEVWNPETSSETTRDVTVRLVQDDNSWLITSIECPAP